MATLIAQRSTYWASSGGGSPYTDGDHCWWWNIYYDQSESNSTNNRTKIIVDYYICTYKQTSAYADVLSYGSGSMYCNVNGSSIGTISYSAGNIVVGDNYNLRYIGSKSTYIPHNSDGTGSFTWQGFGVGKGTSLSTYSVPTINRSSVISSVGTFNVDSGVTVNTTKYVSGFYDRLQIYIGSTLIKTINNFTSGKITFTETELNNIYKAIPTGDNGTFTFKLSTYSSSNYSTQIGNSSSTTARGNLKIVLPEFTNRDYTYEDWNTVTSKLTSGASTSSKIVKGYSKLHVVFVNHARVGTRGASLSHYMIDGERGDYDANSSSTLHWVGPNYNKSTLTTYAVDTRGTSSLAAITDFVADNNFINYSPVTKDYNNSYERSENGVGSQVTISFSGTWWNNNFGAVHNTIGATYKYKKTTDKEYIEDTDPIVLTVKGNEYSFTGLIKGDQDDNGFDISESYDIIVIVEDELSHVEIKYTLQAGEPAIAIYKNKVSLGAMYDESLGGTQVWGNFYKDGKPIESSEVSFASMTTDFSSKEISTNTQQITGFTNEYSYGDYTASASDNCLIIKNTTLCQISGATCGNGFGWIRLFLYDAATNREVQIPSMILQQPAGNKYWGAALPTRIAVLDPNKTYHLKMSAASYNDTFKMNDGFGSTHTWMCALKIK